MLFVHQAYLHESRHQHACRRKRGPGGRFLTKAELQEMGQLDDDDCDDEKMPRRASTAASQHEFGTITGIEKIEFLGPVKDPAECSQEDVKLRVQQVVATAASATAMTAAISTSAPPPTG